MSWTVLNPSSVAGAPTLAFSDADLNYCQALSQSILADNDCRAFPDLIALGFWLRRNNLTTLLASYKDSDVFYKPLGKVFHSAPANVDSLFVYSGILSLLCGNTNLIRLSRRSRGSSDILIYKLAALAQAFPAQTARFQLVQCDYEAPELAAFIAHADARVLWGSDAAIQAQRQYPMPAYAREFCFGHKYSLCLLDALGVTQAGDDALSTLVQLFYRDNMTFSQQACSSAKALIWLGNDDNIIKAKVRFWSALCDYAQLKSTGNTSEYYQALANSQQMLMSDETIMNIHFQLPFYRLQATTLSKTQIEQHSGCGIFLEISIDSIACMHSILSHANQTLTYWGVSDEVLQSWLLTTPDTPDRVVVIGKALDFTPVWDGIDLIASLSRQVLFN